MNHVISCHDDTYSTVIQTLEQLLNVFNLFQISQGIVKDNIVFDLSFKFWKNVYIDSVATIFVSQKDQNDIIINLQSTRSNFTLKFGYLD